MSGRLVVFGREPLPGEVKTRLARDLGDVAAAEVYRLLLEHALTVAAAAPLPATLALTKPPSPAWTPPSGVALELQRGDDLGARMGACFAAHFAAGAELVVLVGSDLPALSTAHVEAACTALVEAPVVLGPSGDGGYWLVGQRAPGVDLFSGLPWSSHHTLAATRARLAALSVAHAELETLRDIDTLGDLRAALGDGAVEPALRRALAAAVGAALEEGA